MADRRLAALLLAASSLAGPALASTKVSVTAPEGFSRGVETIAIVVSECAPELDCPDVVSRVAQTIKSELKLNLSLVPQQKVQETLFAAGSTEYKQEHRLLLAERLTLDAILEIDIPFAVRGEGYGGRKGSESKVEVRLVKPTGEILMAGTGFGRPMNVVTSPERVADRTVKELLGEAFKK